MLEESAYNTSKEACGEPLGSLLGGTDLNYVGHREYICGTSAGELNEREWSKIADMVRQKELVVGKERQCLHRETLNGAWLIIIPHRLNIMELFQK